MRVEEYWMRVGGRGVGGGCDGGKKKKGGAGGPV